MQSELGPGSQSQPLAVKSLGQHHTNSFSAASLGSSSVPGLVLGAEHRQIRPTPHP